jgi:hypothetical protein
MAYGVSMAWGKPPLTVNVGTPGASGDMEAVIQLLERVLALQERHTAVAAKIQRDLELAGAEMSGIHARIGALYPALDRLYRRAGVRIPGRRRRDAGADAEDAAEVA